MTFTATEDSFNEALEDIYINREAGGREVVVLIDDAGLRCVVHLILNFPRSSPVKHILLLKRCLTRKVYQFNAYEKDIIALENYFFINKIFSSYCRSSSNFDFR